MIDPAKKLSQEVILCLHVRDHLGPRMNPFAQGPLGGVHIYEPYFTAPNPLSRLSFLRSSNALLHKASTSVNAKYICMQDFNPLRQNGKLAFVSYKDVRGVIGEPFKEEEKRVIESFDSKHKQANLIFLGLDLEAKEAQVELSGYSGTPYFALDVSQETRETISAMTKNGEFSQTRVELGLSPSDATIYAQARSMLDWNQRNRHCSSCGGRTLVVQGGTKVVCPPKDKGVSRPSCATRTGLHNTAFPRTDPTIITAPVSHDLKRVLLGRGKRWPENYFSCLSGFVEPAESLETASRRETYEETGVSVDHVQIHSTQAWPYPSTLLCGTIGIAKSQTHESITYPEAELAEARWFEYAEIESALDHGHAMWENPPAGYTGLRVPGNQLMAHRVLRGVLKLFHK